MSIEYWLSAKCPACGGSNGQHDPNCMFVKGDAFFDRNREEIKGAFEILKRTGGIKMDALLSYFKDFVKQMEKRLRQKEKEGFSGWDKISKYEYINHLIKNLAKDDFVDVANLAMFLWVLEQEDSAEAEIRKAFLESMNSLIQNVKDGSYKILEVSTETDDPDMFSVREGIRNPYFYVTIRGIKTVKEDDNG